MSYQFILASGQARGSGLTPGLDFRYRTVAAIALPGSLSGEDWVRLPAMPGSLAWVHFDSIPQA